MEITSKVLIVFVLLASTSPTKAEQETDINENREGETTSDVPDEERTALETNVKDESQTVSSEVRLDEATESEADVRIGSDSTGDKLVKRSSSELADDAKDVDQLETGDEDERQVPAKLEIELSLGEIKTENEAVFKSEDIAVNDDQKFTVATNITKTKDAMIDENYKSETQEEKSALTEPTLKSKKADVEVDSHNVEMQLRNDNVHMTSIKDESKIAEDSSDVDASFSADFFHGTRRMLGSGNHEVIDSKARSEEQRYETPDVFSAILNAPNAALNGFNEFGSRRNHPNELSISPPLLPASPTFVYNLPTYAIHTPASTLNRYTVPEVNSFMTERRHPARETTSAEYRQMNRFVSEHASNAYPYTTPQITTQKSNTNPPPYNIFSKLAKASGDSTMQNYHGNFYKPFDPNFNVQNFNPFNAERRRRFTVPESSTMRRVIYHRQLF